MQKREHVTQLNDIFDPGRRNGTFVRINATNPQIEAFLLRLYGEVLRNGIVFEGKIPNPGESNLNYYYEMLGQDYQPRQEFIESKLALWLPRMKPQQRTNVANSLSQMLTQMALEGKTESMCKNTYIRFMCWLYFKFERIAIHLGEAPLPKVLYQGTISNSELQFLSVLSTSGCDVVLVQPKGDQNYLRLDPNSELSDALELPGARPFPPNFSVGALYRNASARPQDPQGRPPVNKPLPAQRSAPSRQAARPAGPAAPPPERPLNLPKADYVFCTNAWMDTDHIDSFRSIATPHRGRGTEPGVIYNCFIHMTGVADKLTYTSELIRMHQLLRDSGRKLLILEGELPAPTPDEIARIRRGNYPGINSAIEQLSGNLRSCARTELHNTLMRAFMELLDEEAHKPNATLNRIINTAVYLLCWFRRYGTQLLEEWQPGALGCLIAFNGCKSEREALFLRFLARTPVDVLVLHPNLDETTVALRDPLLFDQRFDDSLVLRHFPQESSSMRVRTVAAHAEQDLDSTLYTDGFYRDRQFELAQTVTLVTTYEEIALYWGQELKYRPNFSTSAELVTMPVLFAQASGVKDGKVDAYWHEIKKLMTPNCFLIRGFPFLKPEDANPFTGAAVDFFRNGKIQREKLRSHRQYPYALLREELQQHLLNKIQVLIDQKLIRGTFENGTEYQIIATALNLPREILRLIQQFDFTKKNPKLLCLHTGETTASKQDAILLAFLNLVGFDILCYVPTGYQCFGQWYASNPIVDHQLGDYIYDLTVPDFSQLTQSTNPFKNLFKRGR